MLSIHAHVKCYAAMFQLDDFNSVHKKVCSKNTKTVNKHTGSGNFSDDIQFFDFNLFLWFQVPVVIRRLMKIELHKK